MKLLKNTLFTFAMALCLSLTVSAQKGRDQKKPPPKEKPPVIVPRDDKKPPERPRDERDKSNRRGKPGYSFVARLSNDLV